MTTMGSQMGWVGVALGALIGLIGCQSAQEVSDRPRVVATSTILRDLVAQVGGDRIQLTGILDPGADPHIYEPVPADTVALEQADLIVYNGFNLEPNIIKLIRSTGSEVAIAVGEVAEPLDFEYRGQTEPDPHVWGDVENVILMVGAIRDGLIALSPADGDQFTANAANLIADLTELDGWVREQIATIPADQRQLVTTHDAFQYYAEAYGLTVIGTLIGISTEEQPSAQTVGQLVEAVRASGVPAIFAETTLNPALISTVAAEAGVDLAPNELYSDSIGAPGSQGDSYIKMIAANTCTIAIALEGRCEPFEP
ncbi:metal ABC transporter substrate-binding protein [filamentous cyanobacterium CCP5]|nr:metal ABC transporter substrate-binding protein [filamentous cyanobacterium CCP5]